MEKGIDENTLLEIKNSIQDYESDFDGAIERSNKIEELDREIASRAGENWKILESFGPV